MIIGWFTMKNKKLICGSCLLLIAILCLSTSVSANIPLTPPEFELLVPDTGLIGETQLLLDQFVKSASLCGIKITPVYTTWDDVINSLFTGDYELIYFIGLSFSGDDTIEKIRSTLSYLFIDNFFLNYYNQDLIDKTHLMDTLYLDGYENEAIEVFHEIEFILYRDQPIVSICHAFKEDTGGRATRLLIINCDIAYDPVIRNVLSMVIDRELYVDLYGVTTTYDYYPISHLFGWSQYHDTTLPEIEYSIGQAVSTIVHGGYLPAGTK